MLSFYRLIQLLALLSIALSLVLAADVVSAIESDDYDAYVLRFGHMPTFANVQESQYESRKALFQENVRKINLFNTKSTRGSLKKKVCFSVSLRTLRLCVLSALPRISISVRLKHAH